MIFELGLVIFEYFLSLFLAVLMVDGISIGSVDELEHCTRFVAVKRTLKSYLATHIVLCKYGLHCKVHVLLIRQKKQNVSYSGKSRFMKTRLLENPKV
jgi:hypothetical protein